MTQAKDEETPDGSEIIQYMGADRNDRPTMLINDWVSLLPITMREATLLQAVRRIEDLKLQRDARPEEVRPELELQITLAGQAALALLKGFIVNG